MVIRNRWETPATRYRSSDDPPRVLIYYAVSDTMADNTHDRGLPVHDFWAVEAGKLALINPDLFNAYVVHRRHNGFRNGAQGLFELGFLWEDPSVRAKDVERVKLFGAQLIMACGLLGESNGGEASVQRGPGGIEVGGWSRTPDV